MPRILIIPSDHGGGKGHVSRSLYLGRACRQLGHPVAIVLEEKHFAEGPENGLQTYLLDTRRERWQKYQLRPPFRPGVRLKTRVLKRPVFVEFDGLAYQVPRDGYISRKILDLRLAQLEAVVAEFRPDILIGDTHFLTHYLGRRYDLPVVQVTRLAGFPPGPDFMWWKSSDARLIAPDGVAPFAALLAEAGLSGYERAEDLLRGDRYLIPAVPDVEPVPASDAPVQFTGPLARPISGAGEPIETFHQGNARHPRVYVSVGGGAARAQETAFFEAVLAAFHQQPYRVLVSTGRRVPASRFNGRSANVHFADWVQGTAAIEQSDLVIYHGGYGTTMEVLLAGKPAVVIPSHSEQEGNGRRLTSLGLGRTLLLHSRPLRDLDFAWPYGRYRMLAGFEFTLQSNELLKEAETALGEYRRDRGEAVAAGLRKAQAEWDLETALRF